MKLTGARPFYATLAGVVLLAGTALSVTARDPRYGLCPVTPPNRVLTSFELGHARDFKQALPLMGRSPELETDASAYVVIFDGPTEVEMLGNPNAQELQAGKLNGVVCIVLDGEATIYYDVDLTDSPRLPN